MGHWKLPEIKRCSCCIPVRYVLIIWGCITSSINYFFVCNKIDMIRNLLSKDKHDHSVLYKTGELMMMVADMVLVIVLIVAALTKNVKLLKISLIGNLTSVIVYTLYSMYMVSYMSYLLTSMHALSSDIALIESLTSLRVRQVAGACIENLIKLYIMFLLRMEIKKLETNRDQCNMDVECDVEMETGIFKQIKKEDEEKEEEDTFDKQTVEVGYGNEVTCEKEKCDYSLNNITETKYRIDCEEGITSEESLLLINDVYETD